MNIRIEPLSPRHAGDYLAFFDEVAFSDNKEWSECYCQFFYYANGDQAWERITGKETREAAAAGIAEGRMHGCLAYLDDRVAGWCNADRKTSFARLMSDGQLQDEADDKTLAVVCFVIAPEHRREGLATLLLQRICEDARENGFAAVEAYPYLGDLSCAEHYHGPLAMYLKAGFKISKELGKFVIVRKDLAGPAE